MIALTVAESRRAEELATKHFGIETLQLMENAGHAVASLAREMTGCKGRTISVLVGKGKNGGDALVAARFLYSWGATVNLLVAAHPDQFDPLTRSHYGTATSLHMNRLTHVDQLQWEYALKHSHLIVDGLLGTGGKGEPQGAVAQLITLANNSKKPILAIDCPSGLDCDTGAAGLCVQADTTLMLGMPKKGIVSPQAKKFAGKLFVADVGIPFEAYEMMSLSPGRLFEKKDVVKV